MKKLFILLSLFVTITSYTTVSAPKISIFCDHIETLANQQDITFREAAALVKEIGYTGADVWVAQNPEHLAILKELGFEFSSAIVKLPYCESDQTENENRTIEFMKKYECPRVLIVPGFLREGNETEDYELVKQALVSFAERAVKENLTIMVEDYDDALSPCYNIERVEGILAASANLRLVFDTGNWFFAGEDCLDAYARFSDMISHVHLKDRVSEEDLSCPTPGCGCIPVTEVVKKLHAAGYEGWYTIEFFGHKDMREAAIKAYANVSACLTKE